MVREYQVRWEGCSSKFDTWELQSKIRKADQSAVWRWDMEMHAVFGTAKPRAGGGVSARKAIVASSNEPRRSARLKTAASQIGSTNQALQKSSSSCSKNSSANDESSLKTRSPSKLASTGTPYSP
jgi:hypothetical protein